MKLRFNLALAGLTVAALVVFLPGTALAAHVQCGDVLTQSTTLDSDLGPCPGDGLVAGADGIRIDLNGHVITGTGGGAGDVLYGDTKDGVDVDEHDNVTIRNGELTRFDTGVRLYEANGNRVEGVYSHDNRVGVIVTESAQNRVTGGRYDRNGYGIYLYESSSNRVQFNSMFGNTFAFYAVESSNNVIWDNVGNGSGILGFQITTESDHNSIRRNTIVGSQGVGALISLAAGNRFEDNVVQDHRIAGVLVANGPGTVLGRNVIENNLYPQGSLSSTASGIWITNTDGLAADRNRIRGYPLGVYVQSSLNVALMRNDVRGSLQDGIQIPSGSSAIVVDRNTASSNGDDGIDVDSPSTTVSRNTADHNGDYGIEAVPGTDGGGNRAAGNGNPAQCLNVACK